MTARTALALAFAAFVALRVSAMVSIEPGMMPDSRIYLRLAGTPLASAGFWFANRPVTVPLFLKIVGPQPSLIAAGQLALSIVAWAVLAAVVAAGRRSGVMKVVAGSLVLAYGLTDKIAPWDGMVLSESISLSLMALSLAGTLALARRWHTSLALALGVVLAFWSQARDTDALLLGMLGLLATLMMAIYRSVDRRWLGLSALAILLGVLNQTQSVTAGRWLFPFYNVLAQRILPVPRHREFFADRGMPVSPALMKMSGQWGSSEDRAFYRSSELQPFREWVQQRARRTYAIFLVTNPQYALVEPWQDRASLLTPDLKKYRPRGYRAGLGEWLGRVFIPTKYRRGLYGTVVLIVLAGALRRRGISVDATVLTAWLVCTAGLALLVWHGDAMEVGRHALAVSVQWHLAGWLLLVCVIEAHAIGSLIASARQRLARSTVQS